MLKKKFEIKKFSGQNDREANTTIRDDQAQQSQNVFTDEVNGISMQYLPVKMGSLSAGTAGNKLWPYITTAGVRYLISANLNGTSSGYFYSQDGITWTQAKDTNNNNITYDPAGAMPKGIEIAGKFWITDGVNEIIVWDGSDWLPAGAPKLTANASAGTPNGTYHYIITFTINTNEEIMGEISWPVTVVSKQIDLTKIPLGPIDITAKRSIYRTKAGGTTYFWVADIADNTTQVYTDNLADTSLGVAPYIQMTPDLSSPPHAFLATSHQNKLWMGKTNADPDTIFWSFGDAPHVFSANNFQKVPIQAEVLYSMFPFKNTLVLGTAGAQKNTFVMQGDGINRQFILEKWIYGQGSSFDTAVAEYFHGEQQLAIFLSEDNNSTMGAIQLGVTSTSEFNKTK